LVITLAHAFAHASCMPGGDGEKLSNSEPGLAQS
jgi:hypothetical protein